LCATSTAAAAWLALGAARSARAQNARKEIRVGGKKVKVVDIHAHCAFPEVNERVPGANAPRVAPPTLVLGPERFKSMDERGIDVQALSVNTYWWYSAEREAAKQIVAIHDEGLAKWCNANHERFVPLSSVALQFPDLAAEQLEHAVKNLGSRGASIGGHVNGEPPSAPKYDAFWAKAQELDVPVFMPRQRAQHRARRRARRPRQSAEHRRQSARDDGVLEPHDLRRHTRPFSQAQTLRRARGGYLPSYLGRSDQSCAFRPDADCANKRKPSEYFKDQILVDTMVFSPEALRHLVAETGVSQVVYGSDMPYPWPDTIDIVVNAPFLRDADKEAILGGNLVKMLRIVA